MLIDDHPVMRAVFSKQVLHLGHGPTGGDFLGVSPEYRPVVR